MAEKTSKVERSWILYDCANSAFAMAIMTALFPAYFGMLKADSGMDLGYFSSMASMLVAIASPVMGTIADYKDKKKRFFTFFAFLGVTFTLVLAVVPQSQWKVLAFVFMLATLGFAGANIFYDAFLVDVTADERMDRISSQGFAYGYIASVFPFGLSLVVIFLLGTEKLIGYQIGFAITAIWWGLLTIPMLRHVKQKHYIEPEPNPFRNSFRRLYKTFKDIRNHKLVFVFLIAYFLYIDGVDTIIRMAVPYAKGTLSLDLDNMFILLGILLVIQIIAFPFALLYGKLAGVFTAKKMILFGILSYIVAVVFAFYMTKLYHVFILGAIIGSAQGGIQALSRSYYAKIIPKKNANEFFGFYNVFGKFAAILGPLLMSLTNTLTGKPRYSIFAILPLFLLGFIIMLTLPEKAKHEVDIV